VGDVVSGIEPPREDATRRTYLAQERTLLAWWRAGLAAFAVAIGVGRLVPVLLGVWSPPFVTLGVGYGVLGLAFVLLGARRNRTVNRQLESGRFHPMPAAMVWGVTAGLVTLGAATLVLLVLES
jgi:putative membrane protein